MSDWDGTPPLVDSQPDTKSRLASLHHVPDGGRVVD